MAGMLALSLPQWSCYTFAAAPQGHAMPGTQLAFALNDRGRNALADQIGPGVVQIEGTLVQDTGADYVVRVSAVRSIEGGKTRWGGERVAISHDGVATMRQRTFSKAKTATVLTATAIAVTAFILTRNLRVFGIGPAPSKDPPDPPGQ